MLPLVIVPVPALMLVLLVTIPPLALSWPVRVVAPVTARVPAMEVLPLLAVTWNLLVLIAKSLVTPSVPPTVALLVTPSVPIAAVPPIEASLVTLRAVPLLLKVLAALKLLAWLR